MLGKRFCDGLPAKLDADEELCGDDGEEDPALSAQLVALRVIQQLKGFPRPDQYYKYIMIMGT